MVVDLVFDGESFYAGSVPLSVPVSRPARRVMGMTAKVTPEGVSLVYETPIDPDKGRERFAFGATKLTGPVVFMSVNNYSFDPDGRTRRGPWKRRMRRLYENL